MFERIYVWYFKMPLTADAKRFVRNLSFTFIGTAISSLILFALNVLGGRWLGPEQYGYFAVVQSTAYFIAIPMLFGVHASIAHYLAKENDKLSLLSLGTLLFVFTLAVFSLLLFLIRHPIAQYLKMADELFLFAIIFGVGISVYLYVKGALSGLQWFSSLSVLEVVYAIAVIIPFIVIVAKSRSFQSLVYPFMIGYGVFALCGAIFIFYRLGAPAGLPSSLMKAFLVFSALNVFTGIAGILLKNINAIMVNAFLTAKDAGIYQAYATCSITMTLVAAGIFSTVFFPTSSSYKNKLPILARVLKLFPLSFLIGIPGLFIVQYVFLSVYGSEYPKDLLLLVLFAIVGVLSFLSVALGRLLGSQGRDGMVVNIVALTASGVTNVVLNVVLLPLWGLPGCVVATIIAYVVNLGVMLSRTSLLSAHSATT